MRRKAPREIIVSHRAEYRLDEIVSYIERKWGANAKKKFIRKFRVTLRLIARMPEMFPASFEYPNLRKGVVSPQAVIYYQVKEPHIEIVTIHSVKQLLPKLGKEI